MQDPAPLPGFAAIVVAAGQGLRAGQPLPKQFARWLGKPVLRHSVESLIAAGASPIVIAVPENGEQAAQAALAGLEGFRLVTGGETRQQSVARALRALGAAERVLIHDAARPDLPRAVIARLLAALDDHAGAIPVLPVVDSLSLDTGGMMSGTAPREQLRRVQTPQAFRFAAILAAHNAWQGDAPAGDDAQVLRAAGGEVAHVTGDERLAKLTFAEDFMTRLPPVRTGMGYDVHRLAVGEELWLGGIRIEHDKGLAGHSDADVGLHAIVDALLGAIGNIDLTIICEAPKIGPYREAMRTRIAELLGVDIEAISVKATTTERLGFAGRGEGIAAQAVATVIRE